uniref:Uncharacterized protein n=1 Tax=Siphoviridae sp. ctCIv11 TaxID=2827806 RepID=A0A8S5S275_9CAUD|nr:MAG TPA: hypothetical protein [Siphoviridae sp. ctCIv11]
MWLLIFDHALIKLSPIIEFTGQSCNNSSIVLAFCANMYFPH